MIAGQAPDKQQRYIKLVLAHYGDPGFTELDLDKVPPLLRLKCHSLADAGADLGHSEEFNRTFAGFQRYLFMSRKPPRESALAATRLLSGIR